MKNGIPFTKKMSAVKNTVSWRFFISFGFWILSASTTLDLLQTILPFMVSMSWPQISCAVSIFLTKNSQFLLWLFLIIHQKYAFEGNNSFAYNYLAFFSPSISLLVNAFLLYAVVLITSMSLISSGLKPCSPVLWIFISLCLEVILLCDERQSFLHCCHK